MGQTATTTYLTTEEVAERYRTSTSTVHSWRYKRSGPPSIRVGKRRLYKLADLVAWEQDRATEGATNAVA